MTTSLTATLVLLPAIAAAQPHREQPRAHRLSFAIGPGFAKLAGDDESSNSLMGLELGVGLQRVLSDHFGFQPELWYAHRGGSFVHTFSAGDELRQDYDLSYLELAMLAYGRITTHSVLVPYGVVGPYVGALIRAHYTAWRKNTEINSFPLDNLNVLDVGVRVGGGVRFVLGVNGEAMTLEARASWGLRDIYDEDSSNGPKKNRSVTLLLGFSL